MKDPYMISDTKMKWINYEMKNALINNEERLGL